MKLIIPLCLTIAVATATAYAQEKSDVELRAGIEKHPWYSSSHEYRFLDSGAILIDGEFAHQTWRIQDGLLYRISKFQGESKSHTDTTRIIEVTDSQLVERGISGQYKGMVEIMYSQPRRE
jgi:hypothetical protein